MSLAISVTESWFDGQRQHVVGTITPSGNYATGGDALDFTSQHKIKSPKGRVPTHVEIQGASGFAYRWVPGTDLATGKVKVLGQEPTNATVGVIALTELAAAAYPAGVTGDTIRFHAITRTR